MRWKLLVLASAAAAVLGIGLWCLFAILFFGTARELARHDWILLMSALIPLGLITYAGIFVYRHTARRRKTQVVLTVLFSLLLTPATYLVLTSLFPTRLIIPRTSEVRHAR
jgi:cytochrome bd-type quinol oxidase subunit 2